MSKPRRQSEVSMSALSRMNMRDMLVVQDTASQVMADLTRFHETDASAEGAALEVASRESIESAYGFAPCDEDERKPFVYQDGVAVIPIHGTLLNRCNYSWGFVTGYQYIRRMLNLALDDDDVDVIVFDVDSPGGEAAGCFELAREIMASRRVKPSLAMVDALAASGGIALAAPATSVYAIPSARVGSIGVYRMHISYEENLKQAGIKVTFAAAGDHKVDGNPYQDLPQAVLDEWRESAGKTWDDFISLVAEARDLSEDEVRATQARVYRADEALAKGLINAVKTPTEAVAAFLAELADAEPSTDDNEEEMTMADAKGGKEVTSGLTDADIQRIATIAAEAGAKAAASVASTIERKQAIRDHATAIGPQAAALAKSLIDNEAIDADAAIGMLDAAFGTKGKQKAAATAPKGKQKVAADADEGDDDADEGDDDADEGDDDADEGDDDADEEAARSARKGKDRVNHFDRAMGKSKHPNAGGGKAKAGEEGEQGRSKVNPLLADHAKVTGADWSNKALGSKH